MSQHALLPSKHFNSNNLGIIIVVLYSDGAAVLPAVSHHIFHKPSIAVEEKQSKQIKLRLKYVKP